MQNNNLLSSDFLILTQKLMLAREQNEILGLVKDFTSAIERLVEIEKSGNTQLKNVKAATTILKFTEKEILEMSKTFKKEFIANGLVAHVIKKESGKHSYCYEIRYRSNGYNIIASSTDLAEAKRKFLEKTLPENIDKYYRPKVVFGRVPTTFCAFSAYYFEVKRKVKVTKDTFEKDLSRFNKHLAPRFQEKPLSRITLVECQDVIDNLIEQEKFKTASEVLSLLRAIFDFAKDNHIILHSPVDAVVFGGYERESGVALSFEEEKLLIDSLHEPLFDVAIALLLYCGLRPNEVETAEIDGEFIKAKNSKRKKKNRKTVSRNEKTHKWIPILPQLRPFISNGIPKLPRVQIIRRRVKDILPEHKLYDLRTTFETRCRGCNIEETALKAMMGHSFGKLGDAYTDVERLKGYLLMESSKFVRWGLDSEQNVHQNFHQNVPQTMPTS